MTENNRSFVRSDILAPRPAPRGERGIGAWLRRNLFASPLDAAMTLLSLAVLA